MEPKPPLVPITDPANSSEEASPAVQAAAKVKADQDQAEQKIQALRYLATIGCTECYPDVEDALLAALDDCTESVRYEAVKALRGDSKSACSQCCQGGCCSEKIQKKLSKLVNDYEKDGSRVETSQRIRRQARLILQTCGPPNISNEPSIPSEGPSLTAEKSAPSLARATAELPISSSSPHSSLAFHDPELCVGYIDKQPIRAWELDRSIRVQLSALNKENFRILSPSIRTGILENALEQAISIRLKQNSFVASHFELGVWSDTYKPELAVWFSNEITQSTTFSEQQIIDFYQANTNEFKEPACLKWEKASITFNEPDQFAPAFNVLEYLRLTAEGIRADKPKAYGQVKVDVASTDWEPVGNLPASLQQALLSLPLGRTSAVIRIDNQLILARVLNRKKETLLPIDHVRENIRARLATKHQAQAEKEWVENAVTKHRIWTILDSSPPEMQTRTFNLIKPNLPIADLNPTHESALQPTMETHKFPAFETDLTSPVKAIDKAAFVSEASPSPDLQFSSKTQGHVIKHSNENKLVNQNGDSVRRPSTGSNQVLAPNDQIELHSMQTYSSSLAYIEIKKKMEAERIRKAASVDKQDSNMLSSREKDIQFKPLLGTQKPKSDFTELSHPLPGKPMTRTAPIPTHLKTSTAKKTISSDLELNLGKKQNNEELFFSLPKIDFPPSP